MGHGTVDMVGLSGDVPLADTRGGGRLEDPGRGALGQGEARDGGEPAEGPQEGDPQAVHQLRAARRREDEVIVATNNCLYCFPLQLY